MIQSSLINWRWVTHLAVVLLAVAVLPVVLGMVLDWRLHTSPIITLFMMFLGFNLGIVVILRQVAQLYSRLAPPPTEGNVTRVGGDQ